MRSSLAFCAISMSEAIYCSSFSLREVL